MSEVILINKKKLEDIADQEINASKYRSLERRYNSLIEACNLVQAQNLELRNEVTMSHTRLENAQKNVEINQNIVMKTITDANNQMDSFLGEIAELNSKLSRLV